MALVRVYCGISSTESGRLPFAVVDDSGRLLDYLELSDDPAGYATVTVLLTERFSGSTTVMIAVDSDDHLLVSLLAAAGRAIAYTDDESADAFAERFADDQSMDEVNATPAERRAVGLARALQAGALSGGVALPPREMIALKPLLTAHTAVITGRHAAAVALREVLRELYPAALQAYPDPAEPVALAMLDALPEPGLLTAAQGKGRDTAVTVAARLVADGVCGNDKALEAVTALRVAINETPRRNGIAKQLPSAVADVVRSSVAAVRSADTAGAVLMQALAERVVSHVPAQTSAPRRPALAPVAPHSTVPSYPAPPMLDQDVFAGATGAGLAGAGLAGVEMAGAGLAAAAAGAMNGAYADPYAGAEFASSGMGAPNGAYAAADANGFAGAGFGAPNGVPGSGLGMANGYAADGGYAGDGSYAGNGMPAGGYAGNGVPVNPAVVPHQRPAWASPSPPPTPPGFAPTPPSGIPSIPVQRGMPQAPVPAQPEPLTTPFVASITQAQINHDRATWQMGPTPGTVTPPDLAARSNWPLNNDEDDRVPSNAPVSPGRVTPPWQAEDLVPPPSLRLVEPGPPAPGLKLVDDSALTARIPKPRREESIRERGADDTDLLIFSSIPSAWFDGKSEGDENTWNSALDDDWRAAEAASLHPSLGPDTRAGLPQRVPQANLVAGSVQSPRPLRIVRDAASVAEHTSSYFRGWRAGNQEAGGYAVGGRPGRESASGWDFTRDHDPREYADERYEERYDDRGYGEYRDHGPGNYGQMASNYR